MKRTRVYRSPLFNWVFAGFWAIYAALILSIVVAALMGPPVHPKAPPSVRYCPIGQFFGAGTSWGFAPCDVFKSEKRDT